MTAAAARLPAPAPAPRPLRVAFLLPHPIQYFAPLLRALAADDNLDLTVYYVRGADRTPRYEAAFGQSYAWDVDLLSGYRSVFLRPDRPDEVGDRFFQLVRPQLARRILAERYDAVIVHGYQYAVTWLAVLAAKASGARVLLRGESTLLFPRSLLRRAAKQVVLRALLRLTDACLAIGVNNASFYRAFGAAATKIFACPYSVDNDFFREQSAHARAARPQLRQALGVTDARPILLFCGKLVDYKQPMALLRAYASLVGSSPCHLVYAGDGPLRAEIEQTAKALGVPLRVTGFLNQTELYRAYAAADVFVLPSREETWGLVVNEAMNFALPCVVTDRVGCAPDLVVDGETGFVVRAGDPDGLAAALRQLVDDPGRREAMGAAGRERIAGRGIAATAAGIAAALSAVCRRG